MAKARSSKGRLEKARHDKAVAKRERREEQRLVESETEAEPETMSQEEILAALADVHARYAAGDLSLDAFDEEKDGLVRRLRVD